MFTSSSKIYCNGILKNVIEDQEEFFDFKIFKDHLYYKPNQNIFIKNLDLLLEGRSLKDIIIVDNKSSNYADHIFNGIPIKEYNGDPSDNCLKHLSDYLIKRMLTTEDVRSIIKEDFLRAVIKDNLDFDNDM